MTEFEQVNAVLARMAKALSSKGIVNPEVEFRIRANMAFQVTVQTTYGLKSLDGNWYKNFTGDTPEDALQKAEEFVEALPDPETLAMTTYLGKLADAVDFGHANGIDAQYVDPVRITQKAMSDNLLAAR